MKRLMLKIKSLEIIDIKYNWIEDWLKGRVQRVVLLGSAVVVNLHLVERWSLWRARLARAYRSLRAEPSVGSKCQSCVRGQGDFVP